MARSQVHDSPAEKLLKHLGVTEPEEIDVEAIAHYLGVSVVYRHLEGCDAQIVGCGDCAVATINSRSNSSRRRFSLAHELGHWHLHRGKVLVCKTEGDVRPILESPDPERAADNYAAALLLPKFLFERVAAKHTAATFEAVDHLADRFACSFTATLIRLVQLGPEPAFVVCHNRSGRRWFVRGPKVPEYWFPKKEPDADSSVLTALYGSSPRSSRKLVSAEAWFDRQGAAKYRVYEQTMRVSSEETLSIVALRDKAMLDPA